MTNLTSRQHEYLKAMGIDVWLPRDTLVVDTVELEPEQVEVVTASESQPVSNQLAEPISETVSKSVALEITPPQSDSIQADNDISTLDWNALQTRVAECQLCELHATRTQTVFGIGNIQADWLILGDAPAADEDREGEPFVGEVGQLLTAMLKAIGLSRQQVYITNILKCCPQNNLDPKPEEITSCITYLHRQIELLQPKIILALGSNAAQGLLQTNTSLGRLRGKIHHIEITTAPVIVTYHPTYLLRSPLEKRNAWEDLLFAVKTITEQQA